MTDSKYYTPTIDEFHVGFECEVNRGGEFSKYVCTIDIHQFPALSIDILNKNVRVKYLDQEDIESLGWEWQGENSFMHNDQFWLTVSDNQNLCIEEGDGHGDFSDSEVQTLFNGTIRNVSELRKLMKQLGITNKLPLPKDYVSEVKIKFKCDFCGNLGGCACQYPV